MHYTWRQMRTVLLFIPRSRHVFKDVLDGVTRGFKATPANVQIVEYGDERTDVPRLLEFWKPSGCIVEASYGLPASLQPRHFHPIPVVYLDQCPRDLGEPILEVRNDEAACGIAAAKEILAAETPHYAFVGHPQRGLAWSDERGNAFIRAIRLHNLPCSRFETPRGKVLRKDALRDWILNLPKPCGIFAANDFTAEELIAVGNSVGINFARDLRIISFDNDEQICLRTQPTVSSLWPDYERAGFLCAETLLRKWKSPRMRKSLSFYGLVGVIHRESSVKPILSDFHIQSAIGTIRSHACDPDFSVDHVALAMNCSRRLAERRFKLSTGLTIRDEIRKTRFERVFALLSSHTCSIGQIARSCGYGTSAALRIAFRKQTGMSLSDWRNARGRFPQMTDGVFSHGGFAG